MNLYKYLLMLISIRELIVFYIILNNENEYIRNVCVYSSIAVYSIILSFGMGLKDFINGPGNKLKSCVCDLDVLFYFGKIIEDALTYIFDYFSTFLISISNGGVNLPQLNSKIKYKQLLNNKTKLDNKRVEENEGQISIEREKSDLS